MLSDLTYRLRALFRHQEVEDELSEELQYCIAPIFWWISLFCPFWKVLEQCRDKA